MATLPARDVAALIADANQREDQAARDSENLAMLVDRVSFEMTWGYVGDTTDPDDPEVKRDRALRAKYGIKPPPTPIVPPVAHRAPEITAEMVARYQAAQEPYRIPDTQPKSKLAQLNAHFGRR